MTNPVRDTDLPVAIDAVSAPTGTTLFKWRIGLDSMLVKWAEPSLLSLANGNATFEEQEAVYKLPEANQWVYFVIETTLGVPHPIHLHGHDFFILAAAADATFDSSVTLQLDNPPRRDVATLPAAGYLVISFLTDNPGAWLVSLLLFRGGFFFSSALFAVG